MKLDWLKWRKWIHAVCAKEGTAIAIIAIEKGEFKPTSTQKRVYRSKTTCSKCGEPNDRLPQRYCKKCHAEANRDARIRLGDRVLAEREACASICDSAGAKKCAKLIRRVNENTL